MKEIFIPKPKLLHNTEKQTEEKCNFTEMTSLMKWTHLTTLILFVLQSRNAYELDGEHDDFKMIIDGATSDQIANLDLDNISIEDQNEILTTTTPTSQLFETFVLKKTIDPTANNGNETNNSENMKAYKIVSNKPIVENSLVKIVMAPKNVLEKISKQERINGKYGFDKIDKGANVPMKNDSSIKELIQIGNHNVKVEVFSVEQVNDGLMDAIQSENNGTNQDWNNIKIITSLDNAPLHMISADDKSLKDSHEKMLDEPEELNNLPAVDTEIDSRYAEVPIGATQGSIIDSSYTEAEELVSNPTTSNNLIQSSITSPPPFSSLENMEFESAEQNTTSTEIISSNPQGNFESFESLQWTSLESSTESTAPLVVLKVLNNHTVLVEEPDPKSIPDQYNADEVDEPISLPSIERPKKINRPTTKNSKPSQYPKKANSSKPYKNYPKTDLHLDDISFESTPQIKLSDVETTQEPQSDSTSKGKSIKRAIGDEGQFSSIVRPSPVRPIFSDLLPRETEAERSERLTQSMQRLMHFITVVGQIDSYVTKRLRHGAKNFARMLDSVEEDTRRRRNRLYM
ncbi:hypothetical protein Bhyg_07651 [Pseudolycoriella hygida]|uniref:Uncharacterized protein n=1 Tax=Pseudolycoriella hygida TaxID=35572 RepID=A0A9Q0N331_9DIPT|nr:hypothetical protein Bhyg_07651 [Pseudolycoriella hygida]